MIDVSGQIDRVSKILTFLLDPRKTIEVFGMFGAQNLGDEAMWVAASQFLGTHSVVPSRPNSNFGILRPLLRRRSRPHLLVGGGTLIHGGDPGWLDYVENRFTRGSAVSFFGTGIAFAKDQVAQPSPEFKRWARIISRATAAYVRGPYSSEYCRKMGAEAEVFGDFAFMLHDPTIPLADHSRRSQEIGLNFGECLGDQERFEEECAKALPSLRNYTLKFHAVHPGDIVVTQRILQRAGIDPACVKILTEFENPKDFMQSVRSYTAFIGLKMHAAGLAMIAGVPTLMMEYMPKCRDFMAGLTPSEHMLIPLPLTHGVLLNRLLDLLDNPRNFTFQEEIAHLSRKQRKVLKEHYFPASLEAGA